MISDQSIRSALQSLPDRSSLWFPDSKSHFDAGNPACRSDGTEENAAGGGDSRAGDRRGGPRETPHAGPVASGLAGAVQRDDRFSHVIHKDLLAIPFTESPKTFPTCWPVRVWTLSPPALPPLS